MIQFSCSDCGKKLTVSDDSAGKLAKCPNCEARVRVPAQSAPAPEAPPAPAQPTRQPAKVSRDRAREVAPIDDLDEESEEEPRNKRRRREDDEEPPGFMTANRIRGIVALVMSIGVLIFALTFEKFKSGEFVGGEYGTPVGCVLAGLLAVSGVYYLIRG